MYQYEIPVLRWSEDDSFEALSGRTGKGGQVMRHRIDKDKLVGLIQKWTAEMNPSSTSEVRPKATSLRADQPRTRLDTCATLPA